MACRFFSSVLGPARRPWWSRAHPSAKLAPSNRSDAPGARTHGSLRPYVRRRSTGRRRPAPGHAPRHRCPAHRRQRPGRGCGADVQRRLPVGGSPPGLDPRSAGRVGPALAGHRRAGAVGSPRAAPLAARSRSGPAPGVARGRRPGGGQPPPAGLAQQLRHALFDAF